MRTLVFCLVLLLGALPAGAVEPRERLADPGAGSARPDDQRELRCLVCQNESIDESGADLGA